MGVNIMEVKYKIVAWGSELGEWLDDNFAHGEEVFTIYEGSGFEKALKKVSKDFVKENSVFIKFVRGKLEKDGCVDLTISW